MASSATSSTTPDASAQTLLGRLPAGGPARAQRPLAALEALRMVRSQRLAIPRIAVGVHAVAAADACRLVMANGTQLAFGTPRPEAAQASHVLAAAWTLGERLSAEVSRAFAARRFVLAQTLDELGTVLLFRLAERLFTRTQRRAGRSGMSLGDPLAPGDPVLALPMLAPVLDLAHARRAGIRIAGSGSLWPPKSGAALALLGPDLPPGRRGWDCAACQSADRCRLRHP